MWTPELARVLVTEGDWDSFVSRGVRWASDSEWTHTFVITGPDELTEAWFPKVRTYRLSARLEELHRQGREYRVLELPDLTPLERQLIARKARSYVGRYYDVGQIASYLFTRAFRNDGTGTLICSRLVTAAHREGLGAGRGDLFPFALIAEQYGAHHPRAQQLLRGYATPQDLLRSRLVEVARSSAEPLSEAA